MNPKQLQRMLKQMGIKAKEIPVEEVIFVLKDGTKMKFVEPQVVETVAMGQKSYQIIGEPIIEKEEFSEEDVKIVMKKTGVDEETARNALKKAKGDIAEAIMIILESQ